MWFDVPWAKVDNPNRRLTCMDSELPEVAVVCDYDAPMLGGMRQHVGICLAAEARLYHGEYVLASLPQDGNHVRMNILVG